jgi:hypothetical protein
MMACRFAEFHTYPRSAPMVNVGAQLVKTAGGTQGPQGPQGPQLGSPGSGEVEQVSKWLPSSKWWFNGG